MLYQQIASNKRKTVLVVLGFLLLVGMIGAAIGYTFAGSATMGVVLRSSWALSTCLSC